MRWRNAKATDWRNPSMAESSLKLSFLKFPFMQLSEKKFTEGSRNAVLLFFNFKSNHSRFKHLGFEIGFPEI